MVKRGRKDNWIGHILRRSCVIKRVIEGKIDGSDGKTRKRLKRLLVNLKETRGCWKLKEEALDRTLENSLWKRIWTCRKTDYGMTE
jgi:hypothetical protein